MNKNDFDIKNDGNISIKSIKKSFDGVEVLKDVIPRIKQSGFDGFIISISNPADVVATYLCKHLKSRLRIIDILAKTSDDVKRKREEFQEPTTLCGKNLKNVILKPPGIF